MHKFSGRCEGLVLCVLCVCVVVVGLGRNPPSLSEETQGPNTQRELNKG